MRRDTHEVALVEEHVVLQVLAAAVLVGAGTLLVWLARATASGRLRRDPAAGIRVPATKWSEEAWRGAHIRAEHPTECAGTTSIVGGLVALVPLPDAVPWPTVLVGSVAMLALVLHGARVGNRAAKEIPATSDA